MMPFAGVPVGPPHPGLLDPGSPEDFLDLAVILLQHLVDIAWRAGGQRPRMVDLVAFGSVALLSNGKQSVVSLATSVNKCGHLTFSHMNGQ
jgi:hypothetical protein